MHLCTEFGNSILSIQPPKTIIGQAKFQFNLPVHTISFNCDDPEANEFLYQLALETGGRFQYFSIAGCQPPPPVAATDEEVGLTYPSVS